MAARTGQCTQNDCFQSRSIRRRRSRKAVDPAKLEAQQGPVHAALAYIEEKQEKGFNMDVRAGERVPEEDPAALDDAQHAALTERSARLRLITERSAQLKVLERQSAPILSLSKAESDSED